MVRLLLISRSFLGPILFLLGDWLRGQFIIILPTAAVRDSAGVAIVESAAPCGALMKVGLWTRTLPGPRSLRSDRGCCRARRKNDP